MRVKVFEDKSELGRNAAEHAARVLRSNIAATGEVRLVAATGAAQFDFLEALTNAGGIDWPRVELFHLDEYVGLPVAHPASFRKFIMERIIEKTGITRYHLLDGEGDAESVAKHISQEIASKPVDLMFAGIGENGHLAFNDPPANFETEAPYLVVKLDEVCRQQQVGEGWFANLAEVPTKALSMSVRQVLKAKEILVIVPDLRKAKAVKACLEGEISPAAPASILQKHPNVTVYLDRNSASLLSRKSAGSV